MTQKVWRIKNKNWSERHAVEIVDALFNMSGRYYIELHGEFSGALRDAENYDEWVSEFETAEELVALLKRYKS